MKASVAGLGREFCSTFGAVRYQILWLRWRCGGYSGGVGSKTFDGVWFSCFSDDHPPPHVHGRIGRVQVIIDVFHDGIVREARRWDAVTPPNAKRSDVEHGSEVWALWERTHG